MKGFSLAIVLSLLGLAVAPRLVQAQSNSLNPAAVATQNSRYQAAEGVWQRILINNPENAQAYFNLGIAQANQLKWQEAVDSYEQAIALDPDFAHAYCNLGLAQAKLEQFEAAAQSYRRALAIEPHESLAQEMLTELESLAHSHGIDLASLLDSSSL